MRAHILTLVEIKPEMRVEGVGRDGLLGTIIKLCTTFVGQGDPHGREPGEYYDTTAGDGRLHHCFVMVKWDTGGEPERISTAYLMLRSDEEGNTFQVPPNYQRAGKLPYQPVFDVGDEVHLKSKPEQLQVVVRIKFETNTGVPQYQILPGKKGDFKLSGDHLTHSRPLGAYRSEDKDPSYRAEELELA